MVNYQVNNSDGSDTNPERPSKQGLNWKNERSYFYFSIEANFINL